MSKVLLVGAGAEVDLGFSSGSNFTYDTFYRNRKTMMNALDTFYQARVGASSQRIPEYSARFLFDQSGATFRNLIENINEAYPDFIKDELGYPLANRKVSDLTTEEFKVLYDSLIVENQNAANSKQQAIILESIPKDSHYGILESYYSDILHPNKHPYRFWKLINFYWGAFFSIISPITDSLLSRNREYLDDKYDFVLSNLNGIIEKIFTKENAETYVSRHKNSYYRKLQHSRTFNYAITTNYTPYAASIVDCNLDKISWLNGKLSQFENLETLDVIDVTASGFPNDAFPFPYLMCQSPVKPIINSMQINAYAKAIEHLTTADEITVLGYSFCDEDAHIASMVGSSLRKNENQKLIFFQYLDKNAKWEGKEADCSRLAEKIRGPDRCRRQIEVQYINGKDASRFDSYLEQ